MQGLAGLRVPVNLDVYGMLRQRQPIRDFLDISSGVEEVTQSLQVFHFHCFMQWRPVVCAHWSSSLAMTTLVSM